MICLARPTWEDLTPSECATCKQLAVQGMLLHWTHSGLANRLTQHAWERYCNSSGGRGLGPEGLGGKDVGVSFFRKMPRKRKVGVAVYRGLLRLCIARQQDIVYLVVQQVPLGHCQQCDVVRAPGGWGEWGGGSKGEAEQT